MVTCQQLGQQTVTSLPHFVLSVNFYFYFFLHIVISSDINVSCKKNLSQNKFRSIDVVDHSHHVDHCHIHNNKWIQTQDQKNHCMFYLFINTR